MLAPMESKAIDINIVIASHLVPPSQEECYFTVFKCGGGNAPYTEITFGCSVTALGCSDSVIRDTGDDVGRA